MTLRSLSPPLPCAPPRKLTRSSYLRNRSSHIVRYSNGHQCLSAYDSLSEFASTEYKPAGFLCRSSMLLMLSSNVLRDRGSNTRATRSYGETNGEATHHNAAQHLIPYTSHAYFTQFIQAGFPRSEVGFLICPVSDYISK
jgi:hypothetical protein